MPDAERAAQIDGRTARRERNRDAVLDAVIDLFAEEDMFPGPGQVAERSGVSRRSVQRYFADSEALVRAAMDRQMERARPLFEIDDLGEGRLEDRVARIVSSRVRGFDAIAPVLRAATVRARSNPMAREQMGDARRGLMLQSAVMFRPELAARDVQDQREVISAIDVVLSFEAVERLRHERGLPVSAVRRTLERATLLLLQSSDSGHRLSG